VADNQLTLFWLLISNSR